MQLHISHWVNLPQYLCEKGGHAMFNGILVHAMHVMARLALLSWQNC